MNTQSSYLKEFVSHVDDLLQALLAYEVLPNSSHCTRCSMPAHWRCKDCTIKHLFCWTCMWQSHMDNFLHHIECWTGTYFQVAALWEVGVYMLLVHQADKALCLPFSGTKKPLRSSSNRKTRKRQTSAGLILLIE